MTWFRALPAAVRIAAGCTAVVALGAGVLSWDALMWGAGELGIDQHLRWILGFVVDGAIAVAMTASVALRDAPGRTRTYVWTVLAVAVGYSTFVNGAHAGAGGPQLPLLGLTLHQVGGTVPTIALAASLHVLVILGRHTMPAHAPARTAAPPAPRGRPRSRRRAAGEHIRVLQQEAVAEGQKLTGAAAARAAGTTRQYANRVLRELRGT